MSSCSVCHTQQLHFNTLLHLYQVFPLAARATAETYTGPMCFPKGNHVSCCATLTDQATHSYSSSQPFIDWSFRCVWVAIVLSLALKSDHSSLLQAELTTLPGKPDRQTVHKPRTLLPLHSSWAAVRTSTTAGFN